MTASALPKCLLFICRYYITHCTVWFICLHICLFLSLLSLSSQGNLLETRTEIGANLSWSLPFGQQTFQQTKCHHWKASQWGPSLCLPHDFLTSPRSNFSTYCLCSFPHGFWGETPLVSSMEQNLHPLCKHHPSYLFLKLLIGVCFLTCFDHTLLIKAFSVLCCFSILCPSAVPLGSTSKPAFWAMSSRIHKLLHPALLCLLN